MPDRFFDVAAFVYGHRGLWGGGVPENSLSAFQACAGADIGCELDVRLTADGEIVVFHDTTLQRMCNAPHRVDVLSLAELRTYCLPDGSSIPTLVEALEAMDGRPTLIEVKVDADERHIIEPLVEFLRECAAPAAVMSFDEETVQALVDYIQDRPIGMLIEPEDVDDPAAAIMKAIRADQSGCTYFGPHTSVLPEIAHQFGHRPQVTWTVRDTAQLAAMRACGAAPIFEGLSPTLAKTFANTI